MIYERSYIQVTSLFISQNKKQFRLFLIKHFLMNVNRVAAQRRRRFDINDKVFFIIILQEQRINEWKGNLLIKGGFLGGGTKTVWGGWFTNEIFYLHTETCNINDDDNDTTETKTKLSSAGLFFFYFSWKSDG